MADTKITALAAITTVDPAADVLPIVDVSDTSMAASGTTKKITSNQILGAGGTATLASATITGDLTVDTSTLFVNSTSNAVCVGTLTSQNVSAGRGNLTIGGTSSSILNLSVNGADTGYIIHDGTNITFNNRTNGYVEFFANGLAQHRIAPLGVFSWYDGAGGTRMTLNSTGLGVGVSPATKLDVRGTINGNQAIFTGTVNRGLVISTRSDSLADDRTVILNAQYATGSLGQLVIQTAGTDRLLVDNAGNVGVGITPKSWLSSYKAIQLGYSTSLSSTTGTDFAGLSSNAYVDSVDSRWERIVSGYATQYYQNAGDGQHIWRIAGTAAADTAITWTNAMTLDASGNLLVGKTATDLQVVGCELKANGTVFSTLVDTTNAAASSYQLYSTGAATYRFYVGMGGTVFATNTTISAISDARFKENVQDIDVGLGAILALKPRKFDWKAGKGKDIKGDRGFIAQEFEQVFPNLVDEWKDAAPEGEAPYKSVRQDLIPVLVKAIQELAARVEALEA